MQIWTAPQFAFDNTCCCGPHFHTFPSFPLLEYSRYRKLGEERKSAYNFYSPPPPGRIGLFSTFTTTVRGQEKKLPWRNFFSLSYSSISGEESAKFSTFPLGCNFKSEEEEVEREGVKNGKTKGAGEKINHRNGEGKNPFLQMLQRDGTRQKIVSSRFCTFLTFGNLDSPCKWEKLRICS